MRSPRSPRNESRARPRLETLEDRTLLASGLPSSLFHQSPQGLAQAQTLQQPGSAGTLSAEMPTVGPVYQGSWTTGLSLPFRVLTQNALLRPSSLYETVPPLLGGAIGGAAGAVLGTAAYWAGLGLGAPMAAALAGLGIGEVGAHKAYDRFVQNTSADNEERADILLENIAPFDIVALQEVFDEEQVTQLESGSRSRGYNFHQGPGKNKVGVVTIGGDIAEVAGVDLPSLPYVKDSDKVIPLGWNSGLALLVQNRYQSKLIHTETFEDETGEDALANKGFTISRVTPGADPDHHFYVVNTHLQAGDSGVALRQLEQMFLSVRENVSAEHPVVFLGDLNIRYASQEYWRMMDFLRWTAVRTPEQGLAPLDAVDQAPVPGDYFTKVTAESAYDYFWGNNQDFHSKPGRLDHILVRQGTKYGIEVDDVRVEKIPAVSQLWEQEWKDEPIVKRLPDLKPYVSDHFGLSANLRLVDIHEIIGPRVVSSTSRIEVPLPPILGQSWPRQSLKVTFSKPVAEATFTAGDVTILDPAGREVPVLGVLPMGSRPQGMSLPSPHSQNEFVSYSVTFQPSGYGTYSLFVGPDVRDRNGWSEVLLFDRDFHSEASLTPRRQAGNWMDQDRDGVNGLRIQSVEKDRYAAQFVITGPAARGSIAGQTFAAAQTLSPGVGMPTPGGDTAPLILLPGTSTDPLPSPEVDRYGPRVVKMTVAAAELETAYPRAASAQRLLVEFNEPVLAASFQPGDISITGPSGVKAQVLSIEIDPAVFNVHRRSFTRYIVTFQPAGEGGHDVVLGPDIRDAVGNWMDQDGDGRNGVRIQDRERDQYVETVYIRGPEAYVSPSWAAQQPPAPAQPSPPGSILVTNTDDTGPGSLRWAIEQANALPGPNTILFNIRQGGANVYEDVDSHLRGGDAARDVFVIRPRTALPQLLDQTGPTRIDGRSQALAAGDTNPFGPEVVLDGSQVADDPADGLSIWFAAAGNEILRLNIHSFPGSGIAITASNENWVAGNYVGTDATGTRARPNGLTNLRAGGGVSLGGGAKGNLIGTDGDGVDDDAERNVLSGNRRHGVRIERGALTHETVDNVVRGNYIGTDARGWSAPGLENETWGVVFVYMPYGNLVTGNILAAAHPRPVESVLGGEDSNRVEGNLIQNAPPPPEPTSPRDLADRSRDEASGPGVEARPGITSPGGDSPLPAASRRPDGAALGSGFVPASPGDIYPGSPRPDNNRPPTAAFSWSMEERTGPGFDFDGDGETGDIPNSRDYVQPADGYPLWLDGTPSQAASGSLIVSYRWTVAGERLPAPLVLDGGRARLSLPEGTYDVTLEVKDERGAVSTARQQIRVVNLLVVSFGDSYASGEGNPHRGVPGPGLLGGARWADGAGLQLIENEVAHRSIHSAPAQAAYLLERAAPHTSVTFISVAATGAQISNLSTEAYNPLKDDLFQGGLTLPPQVDQVLGLVSTPDGPMEIDRVFISAGGNDSGFGDVLTTLLLLDDEYLEALARTAVDLAFDRAEAVALDLGWLDNVPLVGGLFESAGEAVLGFVNDLVNRLVSAGITEFTLLGLLEDLGLLAVDKLDDWLAGDSLTLAREDVLAELAAEGREKMDGLFTDYSILSRHLREKLRVDPSRVYVTGYPDPTIDNRSGTPDKVLHDTYLSGFEVDSEEIEFAREFFIEPLNDTIRGAARRLGWQFVEVRDLFAGHGYTTKDRHVVTWSDSAARQGYDYYPKGLPVPRGVMHQNEAGNAAMARVMADQAFGPDSREVVDHTGAFVTDMDGRVQAALPPLRGRPWSPLQVRVTFSEAVSARTFTPEDVAIWHGGKPVAVLAVEPWLRPEEALFYTPNRVDSLAFLITFAPAGYGEYTLTIGPQVQDRAGNKMDQDRDGANASMVGGRERDRYVGSFSVVGPTFSDPYGGQVVAPENPNPAPNPAGGFGSVLA